MPCNLVQSISGFMSGSWPLIAINYTGSNLYSTIWSFWISLIASELVIECPVRKGRLWHKLFTFCLSALKLHCVIVFWNRDLTHAHTHTHRHAHHTSSLSFECPTMLGRILPKTLMICTVLKYFSGYWKAKSSLLSLR